MGKLSGTIARDREILAFVHIEKAAGTTLVDIFRNNFNVRFFEVRPLERASGHSFTARDMRKTLRINPFLYAITGHAVKPCTDLQEHFPGVQYITLLRDPVRRYISNYQYWVERMGKNLDFEDFMRLGTTSNFQTRKIAGGEDIELAKQNLSEKFLLVGLVEEFDEFLVMLNKVSPYPFDPVYRHVNRARDKKMSDLFFSRYHDAIVEKNQLDIQLYEYARQVVIPGMKADYGLELESDLLQFRQEKERRVPTKAGRYLYYIYKKLYCLPVSGLIRLVNGLPALGSYGVQR